MIGVMDHAEGVAQVQIPRHGGDVRGREPAKASHGRDRNSEAKEVTINSKGGDNQKQRKRQSIGDLTRGDQVEVKERRRRQSMSDLTRGDQVEVKERRR
jgi:hypothetical protein